jgi:glycosyltransferase involved in cell wall biosynthesis
MPEICQDAALYIDPNEPKDIADKINFLLNSKEANERLVSKGLKHSKNYTWKKSAERLMDILIKANDI